MRAQPLPRDVKTATELMRCDLAVDWRIDDLARRCVVSRRTLEKHFRRFLGCAPLAFLRKERFERARRELLRARPGDSVAGIAAGCGLNHLGRFAVAYRERYGEAPSATLRLRRMQLPRSISPPHLAMSAERPSLAALPFDLNGPQACSLGDISGEIAEAIRKSGWVRIVAAPAGRHHLHGCVSDGGSGRLRIRMMLLDRVSSRTLGPITRSAQPAICWDRTIGWQTTSPVCCAPCCAMPR